MKKLLLATMLLLSTQAAVAAPETYTLDPNHTNITWHANHLGFSNPSGKFMKADGKIILDEAKPEESSVNVTIETASILTGLPKFDAHLKTKDFFNVEKFTTATFASSKVELTGKDTAKVTGNFTMLGVTRTVVLDVKMNRIGIFPMSGKKTAGFSATTTIKRSEFGMKFGVPDVADDIKIELEVEGTIANAVDPKASESASADKAAPAKAN